MGRIIDVHHHILPDEYVNAWRASGTIPPGLSPPQWSPLLDLEFMDRNGIDAAILSLSAPGLAFADPTQTAALARQTNDACAAIRDAHPSRFGFFATLPLENDHVLPALAELARAFDVLHADGVVLLTSYNNRYLGDAHFRPLWQALDARRAVVLVHPASPSPPKGGAAQQQQQQQQNGATAAAAAAAAVGMPAPILDFPHETTRTAVHLITANVVRDFPNVKLILSHGGGTLPFVAERIANLAAEAGLPADRGGGKSAEEFLRDARAFYFDLALTGFEGPMGLTLDFAAEGHVLYGSDFPFAKERTIKAQLENVRKLERGEGVRASVESGAAERLFPRLAKGVGSEME
ncbi:6-methylsalicylate decarboxylase [Madurella fahalii]|uniref:6-methylsalicylate decarboxylase n=1 Tax=Madurella fahalii TaxID=1157608 RepID=A0ABQ0G574_9PEZI